MKNHMRHTKSITFEDIKSLLALSLIVLALTLSACSQEPGQNEVSVSGDTLSAPLPSALLTVDETNLVVAVVVDGGAPQTCASLSVDQVNGTYSCNITLSGGPHTISLIFSIIDASYGTVLVATTSGLDVDVVPGQTASADFSTATLSYDYDDDGDGISNMDELDEGSDPGTDTTAPTVSSTSPAASATGVARNTTIMATFDEDIFATTVDGSSFTLANGGSVSGAVSFDGLTNIATFSPDSDLAILMPYTATLTTEITDLSGNPLETDYTWSFTTVDGAWGSAVLIETDNTGTAYAPQVVFDGSGNAIAVWYQSDGTRNNIWANRYVAGTGWGSAGLIETDNAGDAYAPQIAVDGSGNAIAVWHQSDGTRTNIWANRYVAGMGWGSAGLIETDNAGDANSPQVAVDGSGNAIAVWRQYDDSSYYYIWAKRYVAGTGWGSAVFIDTGGATPSLSPQVAVDGSGNAIAVFVQYSGNRPSIWANRYVAGTGWGSAVLIETDNAGTAYAPQVVFDGSGNAIAVWYQSDGTRTNIWANRYVAGTGWGSAGLIETDNAGDAYAPQIAVDGSGNAIAVWYQNDGTSYNSNNIWANRYVAGTGWVGAGLIETDNAEFTSPQIAVDGSGNAIAVWAQTYSTFSFNIWANRYVAGTGWGSAGLMIETGYAANFYPQVAVDGSGNAIAVWHQSDGTRYNIWANRFE